MEVKGAAHFNDYFRVSVCFNVPDNRDWNISLKPLDAVLEVNGQEYRVAQEGKALLNDIATITCSALDFRVKVSNGQQVKLTIQKIYVPLSETVNCAAMQLQLDLAFNGIKIECLEESHTSGFTVVKWPEKMTFHEALETTENIVTDAKKGPWTFQFNYRQPITETAIADSTSTPSGNEVRNSGITMQLVNAHTEGLGYRTELCYTLPDQKDWLLNGKDTQSGAVLNVMGDQLRPLEEGTMYWKYDQDGNVIERCEYLLFPATQFPENGKLSLTVPTLYGRISGQPDYGSAIRDKIAEKGLNLTMDYAEIKGFPGFVWLRFPIALLRSDPAYKSILQNVRFDYHQGPWSFSFPVNPP